MPSIISPTDPLCIDNSVRSAWRFANAILSRLQGNAPTHASASMCFEDFCLGIRSDISFLCDGYPEFHLGIHLRIVCADTYKLILLWLTVVIIGLTRSKLWHHCCRWLMGRQDRARGAISAS